MNKKVILTVSGFLVASFLVFLLRTHNVLGDIWGTFHRPPEEMTKKWEGDVAKWKKEATTPQEQKKVNDFERILEERKMKEGLGRIRSAVGQYWEKNNGNNPSSLNDLVTGGYISELPLMSFPGHQPTNEVVLYGKEACPEYGNPKLGDSGKIAYFNEGPCAGSVYFDCSHNDSAGYPWNSYK